MDNRVTRFLFWLAFMAFLCASIPHVAWIFDQFEHGADSQTIIVGLLQFNLWQGLSYLIAFSIDALVMWLSFQLSIGKSKVDAGMTWTFILILSALSWYCNWLYSIAHSPASHINIWSLPLFGGMTTVGTFTPLLVSAFPVFSIGYTFMLSRLSKANMTPEELKQQLEAKKQLADIRQQYAVKGVLSGFIKSTLTTAKDVLDHAENTFKDTPTMAKQHEEGPTIENQETDKMATIVDQIDKGMPTSDNKGMVYDEYHEASSQSTSPSTHMPTSSRYVSIEQASTLLDCQPSIVKQLLTRGKLKSPHGSNHLVTRASIKEYLASKRARNKKENGVDQLANEVTSSPTNMADFINDVVGLINDVSRGNNQLDNPMDTSDHEYATNGHSMQDTEALSIPLLSIRQENDR